MMTIEFVKMQIRRMLLIAFMCLVLSDSLLSQTLKQSYQFASDIELSISSDTAAWKYQVGAAAYSRVGLFKASLITIDREGNGARSINGEDSALLQNFEKIPAKPYIIEKAKNAKITIINEAHHNAMHRVFTRSLLQDLYNSGYRYLGLEALDDEEINKRKFPTEESGYYIREPEFGSLVTDAIKIGFTVFNYEQKEEQRDRDREQTQAENISAFLSKNTDGKTLIHCGYDHVIEGDHEYWGKAMAGHLKTLTGIDPFTIDQVQYTEKSSTKYNPVLLNLLKPAESLILTDSAESKFSWAKTRDQVDCSVIHPVSKWEKGRPTWLLYGERKYFNTSNIDLKKFQKAPYPLMVMVYRKDQNKKSGVPVDIVEINDANSTKDLILAPGEYSAVIKDNKYNILQTTSITVK